MRIRTKSLIFIGILMAAVTSPKTIDHNMQSQPPTTSGGGQLKKLLADLLQASMASPMEYRQMSGSLVNRTFLGLKNSLTQSLGVSDDFLNPLIRIIELYSQLHSGQTSNIKGSLYPTTKNNENFRASNVDVSENTIEGSSDFLQENDLVSQHLTVNDKFLHLVEDILGEEFGDLSALTRTSEQAMEPLVTSNSTASNSTTSNLWVLIKSTWERLLAYVEEENSLETFMQYTSVRIIERIMSLGDDISLMSFLAEKLDTDFAMFLTANIDPYLGPFRNFDTFYNFTRDFGVNSVIDYFTSVKFRFTMNLLSRLVSAYLEDRISGDLINQYIELISFDNPELHRFYKSILKVQNHSMTTPQQTHDSQRFRRDVLEHITSTFRFGDSDTDNFSKDQFQARTHEQADLLAMESKNYNPSENQKAGRQIIQRDGGYGGYGGGGYGGYGGGYQYGYMSTIDPYAALGALALGTLLGFLLFRLINGTRRGRRDIGDGSLSLWDSDLPDQMLPWGSSVQRMRRDVNDDTQGFSLPPSLRGDVWSSDPLVPDSLLDDHPHEDDIAHHLNHLWRLYRDTNETACVHSHLCDVMANTTAQHLTGKHSSLALLMASTANLMGVARSGQLVDHVTQTEVLGHTYHCPTPFPSCTNVI